MPGKVSWQLNDDLATLHCGAFRASIDVRAPARGLHSATLEDRPLRNCEFLGVAITAETTDALDDLYVRGGDLIARYAQSGTRPYAVSVYWRAGLSGPLVNSAPYVDLVVSVETSLLDSCPWLEAQTWLAIPVNAASLSPSHYSIGRFPSLATSYIEVSHPDDALTPMLSCGVGGVRFATALFGQSLEKGVILRSRLRGLFVSQGDEDVQAVSAVADFAASAPPLTT